MTVARRNSVVGLAVLLTAAAAAADTVITAQKIIYCRVASASVDTVHLALARGQSRTLPAWDVYEVRLPDTARVAELAALLPLARVMLDSSQPVTPPELRTREAMRFRLDRAIDLRVDTLARGASPDAMETRCREMDAVLRECGRNDDAIWDLLHEVNREHVAIRGIWSPWRTRLCTACGGVPGGTIGFFAGEAIRPTEVYSDCIGFGPGGHPPTNCDVVVGGGPVGCLVGTAVGYLGGAAVGAGWRAALVANHRGRVNDLVRKVNLAVAEAA